MRDNSDIEYRQKRMTAVRWPECQFLSYKTPSDKYVEHLALAFEELAKVSGNLSHLLRLVARRREHVDVPVLDA